MLVGVYVFEPVGITLTLCEFEKTNNRFKLVCPIFVLKKSLKLTVVSSIHPGKQMVQILKLFALI